MKKLSGRSCRASRFFGLILVMATIILAVAGDNAHASGEAAPSSKQLYKQYKKTPHKQKAARQAILLRIKNEYPNSKEAVRAVRFLAEDLHRGGIWPNLPARAAYIADFLNGSGVRGKTAASLRKALLNYYKSMGRWDLAAKLKETEYSNLPRKSSKRYGLSYEIGLYYARLGRMRDARNWLKRARGLARGWVNRIAQVDFALSRLDDLKITLLSDDMLNSRSAKAKGLYARLSELKPNEKRRRNRLLVRLASQCPNTYHGRKAWLKRHASKGTGKSLEQIVRNKMIFLGSNPFAPQAKKTRRELSRHFAKEGQWDKLAGIEAQKCRYTIDATPSAFRRAAFKTARAWARAGDWVQVAGWYRIALALQGGLHPMPEGIARLTSRLAGNIYIPAIKRFSLIKAVLDHCQAGEDTPTAQFEMAMQVINERSRLEYVWPDIRLGALLLADLQMRFPKSKEAKKARREEARAKEFLGGWGARAGDLQKAFDAKFAGKSYIYAHSVFELASAWQKAGRPDMAMAPLERLLDQKRLGWKDRKQAELIMGRLGRIPRAEPLTRERRKERRIFAERVYVNIRSHMPGKDPDSESDAIWAGFRDDWRGMARELAAKAPQTYHGNRAALVLLLEAMKNDGDKLSADTLKMARDYLKQYPGYPDSRGLWQKLEHRCQDQGEKLWRARLMTLAARDFAHLWKLKEDRQAFETGKAWLEAGRDQKALFWLGRVVELDETGESSQAQKAQRLMDDIRGRRPDLAAQGSSPQQGSAGNAPLSLAEQNKLGESLMKRAAKLPQSRLKDFKQIYGEIIQKCPQTRWAEQAYWRLSNLYRYAYETPRHEKVIELMKEFLGRYPDSARALDVKNRLIRSYEQTRAWCKAARLYPDIAAAVPRPPGSRGVAVWLEYAEVLRKCGRRGKARKWYDKVLKHAKPNGLAARQAQRALDRMSR
jgi:hypothetical protein